MSRIAGGSDIGRRLAERRRELGLSLEKAAAGASIDPGYLEYLESASTPDPPPATLIRLATALDTTLEALRGAGQLTPAGRGCPRPGLRLDPLGRDECMALMEPGGVGRVVFLEARGPVAIPVNFRLDRGPVVFRTAAGTSLAARAGQLRISFEVDRFDEALSEGWSVLVSGRAKRVVDPLELAEVRRVGVKPWAGGEREVYIRLTPDEVSGRRIRALSEPSGSTTNLLRRST